MSLESVVVMEIVLGGVWGSFLILLLKAARSDRPAVVGEPPSAPGLTAGGEPETGEVSAPPA